MATLSGRQHALHLAGSQTTNSRKQKAKAKIAFLFAILPLQNRRLNFTRNIIVQRSTQKLLIAIVTLITGGIISGTFLLYRHSAKKTTLQQIQHYPHQHLLRSEYETGAKLSEISYTLNAGDT